MLTKSGDKIRVVLIRTDLVMVVGANLVEVIMSRLLWLGLPRSRWPCQGWPDQGDQVGVVFSHVWCYYIRARLWAIMGYHSYGYTLVWVHVMGHHGVPFISRVT